MSAGLIRGIKWFFTIWLKNAIRSWPETGIRTERKEIALWAISAKGPVCRGGPVLGRK